MQLHSHHLPPAVAMQAMNIGELMDVTLRLSDILAEENGHLSGLRYHELPKLQEEKTRLLLVLEAYQNRMAGDPAFVQGVDEKTREELLLRTDDLAYTVEENFRKVAAAKAVNARVMQAMMDVIGEQHRPGTYGRTGHATQTTDLALSVNLNQKA